MDLCSGANDFAGFEATLGMRELGAREKEQRQRNKERTMREYTQRGQR